MGNKMEAKAILAAAGVPVIPGVSPVRTSPTRELAAEARSRSVTRVLVKACAGGGGKGMRVVRDRGGPLRGPRRRAPRGRRGVRRRHAAARALHRRPPSRRDPDLRRHPRQAAALLRARVLDPAALPEDHRRGAVAGRRRPPPAARDGRRRAWPLGKAIGYVGAGTVEFLVDAGWRLPLSRGEHPAPGGAPGHRGGDRASISCACSRWSAGPGRAAAHSPRTS